MKIQSTNPNTKVTKKKTASQTSNTSFDALFSSQNTAAAAAQEPQPHTAQKDSLEKAQANVNQALDHLEEVILTLDENPKNHQQAQGIIDDLRCALQNSPNQAHLSTQDKKNADTMLAVEAKRLQILQK